MCFSCICLFVLYVLVLLCFSSSWCRGLAAICDCFYSSWLDYKTHFDVCADLNGRNAKQKGLHLTVSLRGQAQGVLGNLPAGDRQDFGKLVKALTERFFTGDTDRTIHNTVEGTAVEAW